MMRSYLALICVALLLVGLFAIAKSPYPTPNMPMTQYTMDNGTLAHTMTSNLFEEGDQATYPPWSCLWRPFNASQSLLYHGDLWFCNNIRADCSPEGETYGDWVNINGSSGLYRPGDAGWPSGEPVLSEHDTLAFFNDHSRIGVDVKRHSLMWDNSLDADYCILQYFITNTTSSTLTDLYVARFDDFDLVGMGSGYMDNVVGSDAASKTTWSRDNLYSPNCWVGLRGMNFDFTGMNYWNIYQDPGSESEIIDLMHGGYWPDASTANDWRMLAIYGPFTLTPGTTRNFSIAIAFGINYGDMMSNLNRAKSRYQQGTPEVEPTTLGRIKGIYR